MEPPPKPAGVFHVPFGARHACCPPRSAQDAQKSAHLASPHLITTQLTMALGESMSPDHVAAQVRERSGIDVQAVTLVRSGNGDVTMPSVWAAMTELGHFWAVENGERLELFRAVARKTAPTDLTACHSAVEAARRFLLLHPPADGRVRDRQRSGQTVTAGAPRMLAETSAAVASVGQLHEGGPPTCQACGVALSARSQSARVRTASPHRPLCSRCRHAEHERLRYQQDPSYRARRLAYSAARYRKSQQGISSDR